MVNFKSVVYRSEDLVNGFDGKRCHFEFREFADRTQEAQEAYRRLKTSLLRDGVRDPLITYQGHILIGMRRFEIMKKYMPTFQCIEILEDVSNWGAEDVKRLSKLKQDLYGSRLSEFTG